MARKILRQTIFDSDFFGHGGEKRTAQISELLNQNSIEYILLPGLVKQIFSLILVKNLIISALLYVQLVFKLRTFIPIRNLSRRIYHSALIINKLSEFSHFDNAVLLWEGTKPENYIYPAYFKRLKYKVIGLPHNLESLVPGQVSRLTNRKSPSWLPEEIEMLRLCDIVFTISREENLLLKQFGVNARYLPFFPAGKVYDCLLQIRSRRIKRKKLNPVIKILMLGSIINLPTRLGMINRIDWFLDAKLDHCKLIIAGYSSEELKMYSSDSENIFLLGTLSNDQLTEILAEIDAVLIHQLATSGALTRIPEMLIAGIPVLINSESARSYYNVDGVNIYENDAELNSLIMKNDFHIPALPEIPYSYLNDFMASIS
jgi:hypothetical protein